MNTSRAYKSLKNYLSLAFVCYKSLLSILSYIKKNGRHNGTNNVERGREKLLLILAIAIGVVIYEFFQLGDQNMITVRLFLLIFYSELLFIIILFCRLETSRQGEARIQILDNI
jgi:hypothetical protein